MPPTPDVADHTTLSPHRAWSCGPGGSRQGQGANSFLTGFFTSGEVAYVALRLKNARSLPYIADKLRDWSIASEKLGVIALNRAVERSCWTRMACATYTGRLPAVTMELSKRALVPPSLWHTPLSSWRRGETQELAGGATGLDPNPILRDPIPQR